MNLVDTTNLSYILLSDISEYIEIRINSKDNHYLWKYMLRIRN